MLCVGRGWGRAGHHGSAERHHRCRVRHRRAIDTPQRISPLLDPALWQARLATILKARRDLFTTRGNHAQMWIREG